MTFVSALLQQRILNTFAYTIDLVASIDCPTKMDQKRVSLVGRKIQIKTAIKSLIC